MVFENRESAGNILKEKLRKLDLPIDVVVAIPTGGAIIGKQLKEEYDVPIRLITVSKLKVPGYPDENLGSVADDGTLWLERNIVEHLEIPQDEIEKAIISGINRARKQLNECEETKNRDFSGKHVLLVDDGIEDRSRILAAIGMLMKSNVQKISFASPVASKYVVDSVSELVDNSLVIEQPLHLSSINEYYNSLDFITESELKEINKE